MKRNPINYAIILFSLLSGATAFSQAKNTNSPRPSATATKKALQKLQRQIAPKMTLVGQPIIAVLQQREAKTYPILLEESRCYLFIAHGGSGVNDLSMTININGKEVAGDRISGKQPRARWCASSPVTAQITIKMYEGSGTFAMGLYKDKNPQARAKRVGGAESDFIAIRIRQLHKQFGQGRAVVSPMLRGSLEQGTQQTFPIRLVKGHCYSIIAAGNSSVRKLSLQLQRPDGAPYQPTTSENNFLTLNTKPCISKTAEYQLLVQMKMGAGNFGIQVFSD